MALSPHPWNPDEDGDCRDCWLSEDHRLHVIAEEAPATPVLAPVDAPDTRVGLNAPATSHDAAQRALPNVGTIKRAIFNHIADRPYGATDDELEIALNRTHQSVSASRNSLARDGWIEPLRDDDGRHVTRKTRSGNDAYAWTLTAAARTQRTTTERTA